jgi:hypothetical protein
LPTEMVMRCIPYTATTLPLKERTDNLYQQLISAVIKQDSTSSNS